MNMDGNKDEALKCLQIGKSAIESGDPNRAEKFLNKARRLDPSIEIDDLLAQIHEPIKKSTGSVNGPRKRAPASPYSSTSNSTAASYSEEQASVVREIKRKKDYYEILGVGRSCSVEDVKKGYRKLSLKVHPDKNPAPGAEEAFKKVSKAFQCLSDEGSRRRYDVSGADEDVVQRRGEGGMQGFYADEFDADEIFRNFFFGGMNNVTTTQFRGFGFGPGMGARTAGDRGSQGVSVRLIQLLPVLIIFLLNFMPSSQPIYSLSNSYPHEYRFTTQKGVNYYVKEREFELKYPPNSSERLSLENQVEKDYYSVLSHNCRVEMQQLNWGYRRQTPNCDELRRLQSVAY